MIKVLVLNEPTQHIGAETDIIDFEFEDFSHQNCQNLIEICLKNDKTLQIFNENEV